VPSGEAEPTLAKSIPPSFMIVQQGPRGSSLNGSAGRSSRTSLSQIATAASQPSSGQVVTLALIEAILPFRPDGDYRARALAYVLDRYEREHPDWTVTVAEFPPDSTGNSWCKAVAAMPAVERSTADVIVLADADVVCDRTGDAVDAIARDGVPYAIPHCAVHRLSEQGTAAVLSGEDWNGQPLDRAPYRGREGGGIVVARRETLLDCPLDARFVGWGREDESLGMALFTLHGPPWRSSAPLLHLWHPPQERVGRKYGSPQTEALFRRYIRARRDKGAMRALLQEARDALEAAQPDVRAHAA
jgi:hypothetical protein